MNSTVSGIVIAAFSVALTGVLAYCAYLGSTVHDLKARVEVIDTKVSPFWANVQTAIAKDLHHPHQRYKEMDKLLEKLDSENIDKSERARLVVLLEQRAIDMHPDITDSQRMKAKLMIDVMKIVVLEPGRE